MDTIRRHLLAPLASLARKERVIVVSGARQTGKTTLCEFQLPGELRVPHAYVSFDDPDERLRFQKGAVSVLESYGAPLVVLDEIQKTPFLFDPLKLVSDRARKQGGKGPVFVLTGSSQFLLMKDVRETLAGRVSLLNLHPFSLSELSGSAGPSLLPGIFREKGIPRGERKRFVAIPSDRTRKAMHRATEHREWGGFPPVWHREDREEKIRWLRDYRRTYLERDIADVGQVADLDAFALTQKILCARTGNLLSLSDVSRDVSLSVNTVKRYLGLLSRSFQCHLLPPFFENIGKRLVKSPKVFFSDPGLSRVILGEMSIGAGAAYESWVFSELMKWAALQTPEPELFHYRTAAGLEVDFLVAMRGGILPIEVKNREKISSIDGRSVETFLNEHPRATRVGLVVYPGREFAEIRKRVWAVPDWYLFGGIAEE
ncbi:MAG: ATP-binding protein [Deltaproteobacteria bacterium]